MLERFNRCLFRVPLKKIKNFQKKIKERLTQNGYGWYILSHAATRRRPPERVDKKPQKNKKKLTKALDKLVKSVLISFTPSVKTVDASSLKRKSVKEKERQDSRRRRKFPSVWKSFSSIERMPAEPRKRFCKRRPELERFRLFLSIYWLGRMIYGKS